MGVPSSRNGALAITAGLPSSARTTTSKAPAGGRPSSSVTRATSSAAGPAGRGGHFQNSRVEPTRDQKLPSDPDRCPELDGDEVDEPPPRGRSRGRRGGQPGVRRHVRRLRRRDQRLVRRVPGRRGSRRPRLPRSRKDVVEGLPGLDQLVVLLGQALHLGVGVELLALLGQQGVLVGELPQLGRLGRQLVVLVDQHGEGEAGGQDHDGGHGGQDHRDAVPPRLDRGPLLRRPDLGAGALRGGPVGRRRTTARRAAARRGGRRRTTAASGGGSPWWSWRGPSAGRRGTSRAGPVATSAGRPPRRRPVPVDVGASPRPWRAVRRAHRAGRPVDSADPPR